MMADLGIAEIRAEGRRLLADLADARNGNDGDRVEDAKEAWVNFTYRHHDVLLADPASKCRQIGGPVTLAQSLHMVQPGQEIPKLVFDVCEQVLERFTVCALAPEPAEPLGAVGRAMAKAGLTADDVEAVIASPAPSVDPEEG